MTCRAQSDETSRTGRAVVLGGGFAGLLAARVLSASFEQVVIVERDPAPAPGATREATPQARQTQLFLPRSQRVVERLFPGFLAELEADGFERCDLARDVAWWHRGAWKPRFECGLGVYAVERTDLEERLRRRVLEIPNVRVLWGRAVSGLELDEDGGRVTGVVLDDRGGAPGTLDADLVVEASDAGGGLPRRLAEHGLEPVTEERLTTGSTCATGVFELAPSRERNWRALIVPPSSDLAPRGGAILPLRGDLATVSLYGYHGDRPSAREGGFRNFAATLSDPALARALAGARLVAPVERSSLPDQLRRRHDRARLPDGVLAFGEALRRVDPVLGRGLALAALVAATLQRLLRRRRLRRDPLRGLTAELHAAALRIGETPWSLGGGFARPETAGGSWRERAGRAYRRAAVEVGAVDRSLHAAWLRVRHLERPARWLRAPSLVARVLVRGLQQRLARRRTATPLRPTLGQARPALGQARPARAHFDSRGEHEAVVANGGLCARIAIAETLGLELHLQGSSGRASAV
jgi:2-polyprenyl-6-methoxyphenol hydroxylase-like FAD-dependent oxidoreductase